MNVEYVFSDGAGAMLGSAVVGMFTLFDKIYLTAGFHSFKLSFLQHTFICPFGNLL